MSNPAIQMQVRYVRLLGGHKAPRDFYDEVKRQAKEHIPRLMFDKEYKAEDLVDPDLWGIDRGVHILIGRCMAHLVVTGQLPLRFAGCPRCTNKRYLRI